MLTEAAVSPLAPLTLHLTVSLKEPGICVDDSETVETPDHTKNTRLLLNVTVKEQSVV